jgi:hypothetical protein
MPVIVSKASTVLKKGSNILYRNRIGNGLKFDGVDDYVDVPFFSAIDFDIADPFTISGICIIYDSPSFSGIINKILGGNGTGWILNIVRIDSASFQLAISLSFGTSLIRAVSSTSFRFGELFHFAVQNTNGTSSGYKFYKNNVLLTTTPTHSSSISTSKSTAPMYVGRYGNTPALPTYL